MMAANPAITKSELRLRDYQANRWLRLYDADWLAQNLPPSKKKLPKWAARDDEYLEMVENAVKQIRSSFGVPGWVSIVSIGRRAGIIKPHTRLVSDLLPKTKAFVAANIETREQWHKKKIRWVIQQMRGREESLTVYKVRRAASIQDQGRKLDGFILDCINNSEYTAIE